MNNKFKLTIRTQESEIFSKDVESISVTTELGDVMILADHAAFGGSIDFSMLIVRYDNVEEEYILKRGVIFFSNLTNEALILAYSCVKKEEIDYGSLKEYLALIESKIASGNGEQLSDYKYKFLENERLALVKQSEEHLSN